MDAFAGYGHAIVSIALFAALVLVLNGLNGYHKGRAGLVPGAQPEADYSSRTYRIHRAYLNGVESLAVFATVVLAAILARAADFWVNLLASVAVVSRIAMVWVHVQGIGKADGGARSILFLVGYAAMLALAVIAIVAAFQSAG